MYNSSSTIVRCLDSVLSQTYQDSSYEVIVVNDGSKDDSRNIVENYIKEYHHPNYKIILINQTNGGVSKARNTGLKNANGQFIALLDSDDEWLNHRLERQMIYFQKHEVDFLCALRNNEKIGFPYAIKNDIAQITLKKLLMKVVGQTSTSIFKKKVIENTGFFDENQKYSEDANFWMRISLKNNMAIINEKLVITDNDYGQFGLSSNFKEMEEGVQKNIDEMFKLKKISMAEYFFFKGFSKLKYILRILKSKK